MYVYMHEYTDTYSWSYLRLSLTSYLAFACGSCEWFLTFTVIDVAVISKQTAIQTRDSRTQLGYMSRTLKQHS